MTQVRLYVEHHRQEKEAINTLMVYFLSEAGLVLDTHRLDTPPNSHTTNTSLANSPLGSDKQQTKTSTHVTVATTQQQTSDIACPPSLMDHLHGTATVVFKAINSQNKEFQPHEHVSLP